MGIKKLLRKRVIEWRNFYVDYKELRACRDDFSFKTRLLDEMTKVNEFYFELERQAVEGKRNLFGSKKIYEEIKKDKEKDKNRKDRDGFDDGYENEGEETMDKDEDDAVDNDGIGKEKSAVEKVEIRNELLDGYESDGEEIEIEEIREDRVSVEKEFSGSEKKKMIGEICRTERLEKDGAKDGEATSTGKETEWKVSRNKTASQRNGSAVRRNKSTLLKVKPFIPKTKLKNRRNKPGKRKPSAYNEVNHEYITEDQEFETSHSLEENEAIPRTRTFLNLGLIKLHYTVHKKKRATMEFIKVLNQIVNYQRINYDLLDYCIAKRRTSRRIKRNELLPLIKQSYFYRSKRAAGLLKDVKRLYKLRFVKNDKNAGRLFRRLRRKDKPKMAFVFLSGVLIAVNAFFTYFNGIVCKEGMTALLPFLCKIRGLASSNEIGTSSDPYTPQIFFSLIFVGFYLFGVSLLIFTKKEINHPFIFSFNLDSHMEVSRYFLCTSALHLFYNVINILPINPKVSFAISIFAVIGCVMFPFDIFYRKSRYYVVYCLLKIACTPIFKVRFRHFFFTDYLQSFSIVYRRVLGYFFTLGPISVFFISNCGNLVRLLQCGRRYYDRPEKVHIYNAGKYFFQIFFSVLTIVYVNMLSAPTKSDENLLGDTGHIEYENTYASTSFISSLKYFRLIVGLLSSSFSFVWDIRVDWGLGRKNLLFSKTVICILIAFNLVGRYLWLLSAYLSDFFLCSYEVVRRTNWGIVRVEYEHLNNCDQLKTTSTIKLSGDLFYRKNKRAGYMTEHESTHDEKEESMA